MQNYNLWSKYSLMASSERQFLLDMIKKHKPKQILSVGIAAGANEAMILEFLETQNLLDEVKLISIDYLDRHWIEDDEIGFLVKRCVPHLAKYWTLYKPGISAKFLEEIGGGIDCCIIDTVHWAPGEALDFLMILPFLAKNALLIMHDITMHCVFGDIDWVGWKDTKSLNICSTLFGFWQGAKEFPPPYEMHSSIGADYKPLFQNIGACVLSDNQMEENCLESYFRILNLPWIEIPQEADLEIIKGHFYKYYGEKFTSYFEKIIEMQKGYKGTQPQDLKLKISELESQINKLSELNKIYKENANFKNHLSYKLGNALIKSYKQGIFGIFMAPFAAAKVALDYKKRA